MTIIRQRDPGAADYLRRTCHAFSDEAIAERSPDYRPDAACPTAAMSADMRLALARCLERLGMPAWRAALVASL